MHSSADCRLQQAEGEVRSEARPEAMIPAGNVNLGMLYHVAITASTLTPNAIASLQEGKLKAKSWDGGCSIS